MGYADLDKAAPFLRFRLIALLSSLALLTSLGNGQESANPLDEKYRKAMALYDVDRNDEALGVFEEIVSECPDQEPPLVCGYARLGLSWIALSDERLGHAKREAVAAQKVFKAHSDVHGQAEFLCVMGNIFHRESNSEEARANLEACRDHRRKTEDMRGELSSLIPLGQAYEVLGLFSKAHETFLHAGTLAAAMNDPIAQIDLWTVQGDLYFRTGLYADAKDVWEKAQAKKSTKKDRIRNARLFCSLADVHRALGKYVSAFDDCQDAYEAFERLGNHRGLGDVFYQVSRILENQGMYDLAHSNVDRAEKEYREIDEKSRVATCWQQRAYIHFQQKKYDKAEEWSAKSLDEFKKIGQVPAYYGSLRILADIYREKGNHDKAWEIGQKVREYFDGINHEMGVAEANYHLGLVGEKRGNLDSAVKLLTEALKTYTDRRSPLGQVKALNGLGGIFAKQGKDAEAQEAFDKAITILETVRGGVSGGIDERAAFFSAQAQVFEAMVQLQFAQGPDKADEALEFAERSRARAIIDLLGMAKVDLWSKVKDNKLRNLDDENRRQIAKVVFAMADLDGETTLSSQQRGVRRAELSAKHTKLLDDSRAIGFEVFRESDVYRDRMITQQKPIDLTEVQKALRPDDEIILAYYAGQERTYAWLVPPEGETVLAKELSEGGKSLGRTQIANRVTPYLSIAGELTISESDAQRGIKKARRRRPTKTATRTDDLYNVLIPNEFRARLAEAKHIIIVPDGMLRQLPFEALVVARDSVGKPSYWIDKMPSIAYAPSATIWHTLRQRREQQREQERRSSIEYEVLALGNPDFGPSGSIDDDGSNPVKSVATVAMRGNDALVPLPGTEAEVKSITAMFEDDETMVYLKGEATEARLREWAPKAKYLHVASHGLVDTSKYFFNSRLALTRGSGDPADDGFLTLSEIIMEWPNQLSQCQLVVLSACETNLGKDTLSEGVFGLPHGLFFAGAPAVVASLWRVDDESTSELMTEFYQQLRTQEEEDLPIDKAEALRQAKKALREKYPEPFHWAPFVFLGDHR
jgi:CHAT domain-containing protein/tetratricopeptide (TPR) repeat protein